MKTSRKAAHLLAGSIMTAATIVGGAGIADAKLPAPEQEANSVTSAYEKIEWTYTDSVGRTIPARFIKIPDIVGES